jgi:hypothetical protein
LGRRENRFERYAAWLSDLAVYEDRPGLRAQGVRIASRVLLVGPELVEIVVTGRIAFACGFVIDAIGGGRRPNVGKLRPAGWISRVTRIGDGLIDGWATSEHASDRRGRTRAKQITSIQEDRLVGDLRFSCLRNLHRLFSSRLGHAAKYGIPGGDSVREPLLLDP